MPAPDVDRSTATTAPAIPDLPVEQIRPGVWCLPQPVPGRLGSVLLYAIEDGDGVVLVDAGWDAPESLDRLDASLRQIGMGVEAVRGVLCTHFHFDHYGLAGRLRDASGAWLLLHAVEAELIERGLPGTDEEVAAWLGRCGVEGEERSALLASERLLRRYRPAAVPDRPVAGGERLAVGGLELEVVHTPGHSPGHICLVAHEDGIAFTGDHVLSATTPNVSAYLDLPPDPLGDYLASLECVSKLGAILSLPGHEARMSVGERAPELVAHHELQLDAALALVRDGNSTVRTVAERMPWTAPWTSFGPIDVRLALGEALAHLVVLAVRGSVIRIPGAPERWLPA